MLFYYFLPFIVNNHYLLFQVSSGHNSVTVQNRTHVHINILLRITHTITSQSSADSSWITLYILDSFSWMVSWKLWWKSADGTVQHSIQVSLSRFVTVTQPNCRVWTASGGKRKLLVKCGGSYAVCVVTWCFWQQGCCRMQNLYTRGETKGYVTFKCISFLYTDIRLAGWTDESSGHTHTVQQYEQHNDWLSGK